MTKLNKCKVNYKERYQKLREQIEKLLQKIDADILDKDKLFFCDEYGCHDTIKKELQKLPKEDFA